MTTMRCPLGHPPGPQPFCPICGRATVPVEEGSGTPPPADVTETVQLSQDWPGSSRPDGDGGFDLDVEYDGDATKAPEQPSAPPPPTPPQAPATGPSWSDFQSDLPAGPAAAETKRLIDELQAGRPVTPPTFSPPEPPPARYEPGGVFPSGEIPDYSPTPPEAPAAPPPLPPPAAVPPPPAPPAPPPPPVPPAPAVPTGPPVPGVPPFEMPPRASVLDTFADDPPPERKARDRRSFGLLPLLLVAAVVVGALYFVSTQLFVGSNTEDAITAPPTRSSAPSPRATSPRAVQSYSAAQISASLKDPHFKHGYEAGLLRKKAGAVDDPRATCRAMGLRERKGGYAWGAQDQQGCLVGITST